MLKHNWFEGGRSVVKLAIGAKVVLLKNLLLADGLFNGAIGKVHDIIYNPGFPNCPAIVIVYFDHYIGPSYSSLPPKCVPLWPEVFQYCSGKNRRVPNRYRINIPLNLAYAITVCKSQVI